MKLNTWCKKNGYSPTDDFNDFIQQIKKRILRMELELISASNNVERQTQKDQLDMVRAYLEHAASICIEVEGGDSNNGD
jgi:hypothetical protein